ncbi:MAG: 4Fe-4S dicluster domain-containing protein [Clostridia bacterium]|nr:4Fe-4S dicluster domain-containing protein [Clostridia bacterium]
MPKKYQHSVFLDSEKCIGCTHCLTGCPTEAIRVRNGKAIIDSERCIDCGQCIRLCPYKAKRAKYDPIENISRFAWKIALPAPSFYGQFDHLDDIDYVLQGLIDFGFDEVFEVARAAELVSDYTRRYLKQNRLRKPVISSACPVITRLIGLRFPLLKEHVMDMRQPMEMAAMLAKKEALAKNKDLKPEDIGVCFISPCPAKVSYIKNQRPEERYIDCVASMSDFYFGLIGIMDRAKTPTVTTKSGMIGLGWAATGGESSAIFNDNYLAADGIENVIRVLDAMETDELPNLEFVELNACPGGCVGGVMTVANPYIAQARLQNLRRYMPVSQNRAPKGDDPSHVPEEYIDLQEFDYRPLGQLDDNIGVSIRMMGEIQKIREGLPGLDCGSCGAPTCRALAEDVVKGQASVDDCIIRIKERLRALEKREEDAT